MGGVEGIEPGLRVHVLIVDDQPSQRKMHRTLIEDISPEISVADFSDPVEALLWSQRNPTDLLLLDYRMPKMDGLEFARRFRRPLTQRDVPIVLVTVVGDEPIRQAALEAGVIDFLVKPVRPRELRQRCRNLLEVRQRQQTLQGRARTLERQLLSSMHEVEEREREILARLAKATEFRDGGNASHLERISRYAGLIAEAMRLQDDEVRMIELAAPLHDIGQIGIPDAILLKPGKLTREEFAVVMRHPKLGYEILKDSSSRFVQAGATIALHHHERWDGSGYPDGLAGEAIPMAARIVAVADVLDAMSTPRPYRPAHSLQETIEHLRSQAGKLFDPTVIEAMLSRLAQIAEVHASYPPEPAEGG